MLQSDSEVRWFKQRPEAREDHLTRASTCHNLAEGKKACTNFAEARDADA